MQFPEKLRLIIETARYNRDVCMEAAGLPHYQGAIHDPRRWAAMWESFAANVESDLSRITDSQELLAKVARSPRFATLCGAGRKKDGRKPAKRAAPKISEREARKAAAEFEKEQRRREAERRREEAARQKDRERRDKATAKAQAALDKAEREHAERAASVQAEIETLEKRSRAENDRWEQERERLRAALRHSRG